MHKFPSLYMSQVWEWNVQFFGKLWNSQEPVWMNHFQHFFAYFYLFLRSSTWLPLLFNWVISIFKLLVRILNSLQNNPHYYQTLIFTFHELLCTFLQFKTKVIIKTLLKSMMHNRHGKHDLTLPALEADWQVTTCWNLTLIILTD